MDLLTNEAVSDFQIIVEDHTYKLHKLILYRCEYFRSLFSFSTSESLNNNVNLPYTKKQFDCFLYYLYTCNPLSECDAKKSDLLEIATYLQYSSLINQFRSFINDHQCNVLEKLFPILLICYPEFINKMDYKVWEFSCNRYPEILIDSLLDIKDEILVLKIIRSLRNLRLEDIAPLINSWIDIYGVNLWSKIEELNFRYDEISQEWLRNNSGYLQYDIITSKVNKYHSLIFDFRKRDVISISNNEITYSNNNEIERNGKEMKPGYRAIVRIDDLRCEFEVSDYGMIKLKINSRDEIGISVTNRGGYIHCEEKKHINIDIGYLHDGKYNIYIYMFSYL